MKHVFTLICALMVMMSASAVPQRNVKKQALMQKQARVHALPVKKSVQQSVAQWGQKLMATPAYTSHFAMGRTMNRAARRATTNVTITQCLATFYSRTDRKCHQAQCGLVETAADDMYSYR